jgi:DNA-binding IclR family transcriptional regulator
MIRSRSNSDPQARLKSQQGVQSVEVGLRLFKALAAASDPLMLKDLAAAARMPPAKAHRYLVSLSRAGLVEQNSATGLYDLGPFAVELGLSALGRLSPVATAEPFLEELRQTTEQTVALAVWGSQGPVIVRWLGVESPVAATLRVGSLMPLTRSATGLVFVSFLPERVTGNLIRNELAENRRAGLKPRSREELAAAASEVSSRGYALTSDFIPGISGIAAPVFDHNRALVLALITLGYTAPFMADRARIQAAVERVSRSLSNRLGWR